MPDFNSNKFMKLILTGSLKPNFLLQKHQYTNEISDTMHAESSAISYSNTNEGFTVISLYKIVLIRYQFFCITKLKKIPLEIMGIRWILFRLITVKWILISRIFLQITHHFWIPTLTKGLN